MADRMREVRQQWRELLCFHENFKSTDDVTRYIKKNAKGKHGSFLLRPSNRNRDLLTASVLVPDGSVRHTHILVEEDASNRGYKYFLVVEKKFESISQLLNYYRSNPVRNLENVNNVYLAHALTNHDNASGQSFSRNSLHSNSSASLSAEPPPLPVRPRTVSSGSVSTGTLDSQSSLFRPCDPILQRPPCPLPADADPTYDKFLYSRPRDVEEDISEKLKDTLKSSERCECGIPRCLAELPLGWTVHQSKEVQTRGKLFYQSPEEKTYWQLPPEVAMQLTRVHKSNLKQIDKDWSLRRGSTNATNGRV